MTKAAAIAIVLVAAGCSKSEAAGSATTASATAPASAAASASAAPAPPKPTTWNGTYSAQPGSFYVPDGGEWSGVKFRGDDAGVGLGDGKLAVTIDPGGVAHGTLDGALGSLHVEGLLRDGTFSAALRPDKPSTEFSGTMIGRADGAKIAGTLRATPGLGNVIREGSFTLERAP